MPLDMSEAIVIVLITTIPPLLTAIGGLIVALTNLRKRVKSATDPSESLEKIGETLEEILSKQTLTFELLKDHIIDSYKRQP